MVEDLFGGVYEKPILLQDRRIRLFKDMRTINSISGGKTSSYLAVYYPVDYNVFSLVCIDDFSCRVLDKKMTQRVNDKLSEYGFLEKYGEFIATAEDDKILKVMFDLEQMIGREIVWVRHHSFDKWIDKKGMLPNMTMRWCTTELKIIPICEWVVQELMLKQNSHPVYMNMGIRIDEKERAKKGGCREYRNKIIIGLSKNGKRNKWREFFWAISNYPLLKDRVGFWTIQEFWKGKLIDFPEDSNCVGCFWKRAQQLRRNWDEQLGKMKWFSKQEKRKNHFFKSGIDYDQIKELSIEQGFFSGTGSGCQAGFCTD